MLLGGKLGMGINRHLIELKTSPPEKGEESFLFRKSSHSCLTRRRANEVIVVECYFFLVNIIVEPPEPRPGSLLCNYCHF